MRLQVTLALLCMAFGLNVVNCIKCFTGDGIVATGTSSDCPSKCVMYIKNNVYKRDCVGTGKTCSELALDSTVCAECSSDECNKGQFISCNEHDPSSTIISGSPKLCPSGTCIMYKDSSNNYIRGCTTKTQDCKKLKEDKGVSSCAECSSKDCNKGKFTTCRESKNTATDDFGNPKLCPSDTCIMYKEGNEYIRGCTTETKDCKKLPGVTLCAECSSKDCNNVKFMVCRSYKGPSTTDLGTGIICQSGTCLRYKDKDNINYVRACKTTETDTTNLNPCSSDGCNNAAFPLDCHVYDGIDKSDKGTAPTSCLSGRCIMYKDTKSGKYIRDCVDDATKSCSVLSKANTDTLCSECSEDKCNKEVFMVCHSYKGPSTTDLGTGILCRSGTCLSYKDQDNVNYVRACHSAAGDPDKNHKPCKTDNCNKDPFKSASIQFSLDVKMAAIALAGSLMIFRSF